MLYFDSCESCVELSDQFSDFQLVYLATLVYVCCFKLLFQPCEGTVKETSLTVQSILQISGQLLCNHLLVESLLKYINGPI